MVFEDDCRLISFHFFCIKYSMRILLFKDGPKPSVALPFLVRKQGCGDRLEDVFQPLDLIKDYLNSASDLGQVIYMRVKVSTTFLILFCV
jgi:hypothetical protein